jgi:hypothetical protein
VGQKGEKFCTKRKQGIGELDTCGTVSHTKKALIEVGHIHFWDHAKEQVYLVPSLAGTFSLASTIYGIRGEALTRVQFNELVGLVKSQGVTTEDELFDVKDRILADSGVSFTPRKKPRFSAESSFEYVEADLLPTIEEAPSSPEGKQEHMLEHWASMVSAVQILKAMSLKHSRYETEIMRISDDIDCLNVSSSRLETLVGSPADGIQFNLFGIVDRNEEVLLSVGDELHKTLMPRIAGVEATAQAVEKSVKTFNSNVGGDVLKKLAAIENSVKAMEATNCAGAGPMFDQVRKVLIDEIIPAMTDLWDLYMLATEGPGKALKPGSGKPPGEYLWTKLAAVSPPGATLGLGSSASSLEQRLLLLEATVAGTGATAVPAIPSIFGSRQQASDSRQSEARPLQAPQEQLLRRR